MVASLRRFAACAPNLTLRAGLPSLRAVRVEVAASLAEQQVAAGEVEEGQEVVEASL